jgi:SAM-dependent methyltransferase
MKSPDFLKSVEQYYTGKIKTYGPTAKGVDWNSSESQTLRFEQLLKGCDTQLPFSLNDYGCGYGALADYLRAKGIPCLYRGFDISPEMIHRARDAHRDMDSCEFFDDIGSLSAADWTVASGIFNVRLEVGLEEWEAYMMETLQIFSRLSSKGFAFNALSRYSDPGRRRSDLYYADPLKWFDYCKRTFSGHAALLHDYPLYEFTLLVRL